MRDPFVLGLEIIIVATAVAWAAGVVIAVVELFPMVRDVVRQGRAGRRTR